VLDIAPLVKGHFLVVTHEHLLSFAEAGDAVIESLEKAKRFLLDSVFKTDSAFFFEHGSVGGFPVAIVLNTRIYTHCQFLLMFLMLMIL
jgi:hypothetical protein